MANTDNPVLNKNTAGGSTGNVPHQHDDKLAADDNILAEQYKHIPGWGIDADPQNDPAYPMRHYNGADHQRIYHETPRQQPVNIEVLHSIERPTVSPVFGATLPPQGLSGMIRRKAFEYSEGHGLHWIGLILADRVNVVEGVIDDIKHGHFPNIFAERGWNAEWKYNKKGVIKEVLIGAALIAGAIAFSSNKKKRKAKRLKKAIQSKVAR